MRSKKDDDLVNTIIHKVSLSNNIVSPIVKEIVESQFRCAQETIVNLELLDKTEEDVSEMNTNFYFKYIGKLYVNPQSNIFKNKPLNKEEYGDSNVD